jgi:hypothetical protein
VKAEKFIEKFGLRQMRMIGGELRQKMDEDCIRKFVDGDPSATSKYLDWMLHQAGGGRDVLDRAMTQWSKGEHGEPSLRTQIRECYISQRISGWKDDLGNPVPPVSEEDAEKLWEANENEMKWYHIYGDEDYVTQGGFGFYRSWPGPDGRYSVIVDAVQRFHRHSTALRAKGRSTDLSLWNYPSITSLLVVLKDVTAAELKASVDYDLVYSDEWVQVYCPYNIGASLKLGIVKWCTSSESMFMSALGGEGKNRWKEYANESALYYCHFRNIPNDVNIPTKHVAVQVEFYSKSKATERVPNEFVNAPISCAKYWDAEDKSHTLAEFLAALVLRNYTRYSHMASFRAALTAIEAHFRKFNRGRVVTDFSP